MVFVSTPASQAESSRTDRHARLGSCLSQARAGERGALDEVVRELNPLLWHVVRAQGLGTEEAADVIQTTWLELLRGLQQIHTAQALTAWLITVARREAWRVSSRSRRLVLTDTSTTLESAPDSGPEPYAGLLADERNRVLWRHYRGLSERCRDLLRIIAYADRPDYAAVAEALGMPHGSIGPTRGRCLAKLREMLLADPAWSGQ
jgi:RNA polymerase sigma factor (sigma-70 family)